MQSRGSPRPASPALLWCALALWPCLTGCRPSSSSPPSDAGAPAAQSTTGGAASSTLPTTPPDPRALTFVDYERKVINIVVLVLGGAADDFTRQVHAKTGDPANVVSLSEPGEPAFTYLPVRLGDIRGFHTILHIFTIGLDPRLSGAVARHAAGAKGLIVAEKQAGDADEPSRTALANLPASATPVALVGPDTLPGRWKAMGGADPVFVGPAGDDSVMTALKAVAKAVLVSLRKPSP